MACTEPVKIDAVPCWACSGPRASAVQGCCATESRCFSRSRTAGCQSRASARDDLLRSQGQPWSRDEKSPHSHTQLLYWIHTRFQLSLCETHSSLSQHRAAVVDTDFKSSDYATCLTLHCSNHFSLCTVRHSADCTGYILALLLTVNLTPRSRAIKLLVAAAPSVPLGAILQALR